MTRHRSMLVLLLLAPSLTAGGLGASCIQGEPNRVATIEVESCRDPAAVLRQAPEPRDGRVASDGEALLALVPGVVVGGHLTRKVHVTQHASNDYHVEDVVHADETGTWFVSTPPGEDATETLAAATTCDGFVEGETVELYVVEPCCDTFPPSEPACLLDVGAAFPVPAPLAEAVAAFLGRSESH